MQSLESFVIVVAAGKGLRMGSKTKKQYLCLEGIPILSRTIMVFDRCDQLNEIVLVVPQDEMAYCKKNIIEPFGFVKKIHLVGGGKKRQDSVLNGLKKVRDKKNHEKKTMVLIHDGVRPFVDQSIIKECINSAVEYGACIPAVKITDTVKQVFGELFVEKTLNRENLYKAQTPQVFKMELIWDAFEHAEATCFSGTDDASLMEHFGKKVFVVKGSKMNIKITTPEDLALGKYLLSIV
ncbi:2-C-methyl-D-erythritol 4-phosphate cytidylyltransferase [Desulfobacula toluolica]|uniref:2-C-methyl-D-erythritol 4-phosphate cytidylyltransferase n=1 Tax=Desulfobacula toluolica (strain DSM 7467 / Tol2) TaxID=651182 RepID=K0NKP7_DESTT|nr:2-C-methyl-D-erythritol 4-phosphate cytidylyltransferase [Desulfobacula toluolica]CCK80513.1 IspD: 2-C-methyl-D-erythritol 4-phosphate cytidylyltransferase [Desulfobacula toluolica Tol2]